MSQEKVLKMDTNSGVGAEMEELQSNQVNCKCKPPKSHHSNGFLFHSGKKQVLTTTYKPLKSTTRHHSSSSPRHFCPAPAGTEYTSSSSSSPTCCFFTGSVSHTLQAPQLTSFQLQFQCYLSSLCNRESPL